MNCSSEDELRSSDELEQELRLWASYRSQTLTRTGFFLSLTLHCTRTDYKFTLAQRLNLEVVSVEVLQLAYRLIVVSHDI